MEKEKLYLSITTDISNTDHIIKIKLHTDTCLIKWNARKTVIRIICKWSDCVINRMQDIEQMVTDIYDLLYKNNQMSPVNPTLNAAYKIALDYYNNTNKTVMSVMWDITDLCDIKKMEDVLYQCAYCGACDSEEYEDPDDEEYWEIKNRINSLEDKTFSDNELSVRSQMCITNSCMNLEKKIDDLNEKYEYLCSKLTTLSDCLL